MLKVEERSKLSDLVSELEKLRSRNPEESKFMEWKKKTEKKLEELFGRSSEQFGRFHRIGFFDFSKRSGLPKEAPLREDERARFMRGLDEAKRLLQRLMEG
jgi:hypothetical protein